MVDEDESVDLSFGLEGKVTVVTGGAAGIGRRLCLRFRSVNAMIVPARQGSLISLLPRPDGWWPVLDVRSCRAQAPGGGMA